MNNQALRVLSLFSGGGFLDLGFINQGFHIVEAMEINEKFIDAYNFGIQRHCTFLNKNHAFSEQIKHVPIAHSSDLSCQETKNAINSRHNNLTGIIGGPPCQDFSQAGSNKGIAGERGKLIHSYFSIIEENKPDFIFFENVRGLIRNKRNKISFNKLVKDLEKSGYDVWFDLINCLEYGIPQDRNRVVIVGFKKEITSRLKNSGYSSDKDNNNLKYNHHEKQIFRWPTPEYIDPKSNYKWPSKTPFKSKKRGGAYTGPKELQVSSAFKGLTKKTPNQTNQFIPKSSKFVEVEEGDTNRRSFKRLHRYRYSPTVAYGNNEVHLHPTEPRRISVREAMRLQSVPDSYILPEDMPLSQKFKIIGNGVPPKLASLIAKEIKRTLLL